MHYFCVIIWTFFLIPIQATEKVGKHGYPWSNEDTQMAHVDAHLNLEYLPAWRYSGDKSERRDFEMVLDLWVPQGREACPLVIYVHGGSYTGGHKGVGGRPPLGSRLVEQGIAFASLNYILAERLSGPGVNYGTFPQVWYDYRDAARYLRMHAKKLRLDPTKFGAFGISAGGWLITSAGHGTGDHFSNDEFGTGLTIEKWQGEEFKPMIRRKNDARSVWAPMQNENPGWPGVYGKWQAIAFDFRHHDQFATSGSPAMLDIVGLGHDQWMKWRNKTPTALQQVAESDQIDYRTARMTAPKVRGKGVHCPPLLGKPKKGSREHAMTQHVVGEGEAELADVLVAWFKDRLDGPSLRGASTQNLASDAIGRRTNRGLHGRARGRERSLYHRRSGADNGFKEI